jgi:hypothetical protein
MKGLLGAFFAQVVIITYRSVHGGVKTPTTAPLPAPLPARYVAAAGVYGALAIVPSSLAPVASLVGWGLVVANLLGAPLTATKPAVKTPTLTTKKPTAAKK